MVGEDLVKWIYRLASSERKVNSVCAQICTEIEKGEKEPGRLATGFCIDRLLAYEQKAWAGFYSITRHCRQVGLALTQIRRDAPWLKECDFDSVEESARRCIALRKYFVSSTPLLAGQVTGTCNGSGQLSLSGFEEGRVHGRHPVYQQWLRDKYNRESNGE